jgi:hypothetical protein
MSAKNGLAVSFRRRSRLIGCAAAVVFAFAALFAASAGALTPPPPTQSYLALGDSLAFGYSQQLFNENQKFGEPPSAFEHGYVNNYYKHLKPKENHIALQNNGCPGETTDSMIGNGALAAAFGIPGESPCAYHKAGLPLHHEYGGTKSQLESAIETIAVDAGTGKPVSTITLNIGANDELKAVKACEKEVGEEYVAEGKSKYGGENPEQAVGLCISAHAKALFEHIIGNLDRVLYAVRHGSAFGGADYAGKIIVQGGYDPYGNVFGTGELLKGSTSLAQILNGAMGKNVTDSGEEAANEGHEPWGACFANPFPKFNPLKPKIESERLQKWTNMANFSEFEGKKNGPDIHPTPAGYKVLNTVMVQTCG